MVRAKLSLLIVRSTRSIWDQPWSKTLLARHKICTGCCSRNNQQIHFKLFIWAPLLNVLIVHYISALRGGAWCPPPAQLVQSTIIRKNLSLVRRYYLVFSTIVIGCPWVHTSACPPWTPASTKLPFSKTLTIINSMFYKPRLSCELHTYKLFLSRVQYRDLQLYLMHAVVTTMQYLEIVLYKSFDYVVLKSCEISAPKVARSLHQEIPGTAWKCALHIHNIAGHILTPFLNLAMYVTFARELRHCF